MGKTINESLTKKQTPIMAIAVATLLLISAILILSLRVFSDHKLSEDTWENYAAESYAGGSGSIDDPFVISDSSELALLAKETNQGKNTKDVYYVLAKDVSLKEHAWMPIGENISFEGTFDGAGYTINGIVLEAKDQLTDYGLFGRMAGTVCNLNLTDAEVSILYMTNRKNWQPAGGVNVAILCGTLTGQVSAVSIKGTIDTQESENIVVGMLAAVADNAQIDAVEVKGDVTVYNDEKVVMGGVCGSASGNTSFNRVAYKGNLNYSDNSDKADIVVSGFVGSGSGWDSVYIKNCQSVSVLKLPKNVKATTAGLCSELKTFSNNDFVFCSLTKSYIEGDKKNYLSCFGEDVIDEDVTTVDSVADENAVIGDNGVYASGYFSSSKKFNVYGGSSKELSNTNYKKYFKKTLGYNFAGAWTKGASNYPVSKYDSKSYSVESTNEAYKLVFHSASKAYLYEYGKMDYEYTGIHEQDGESWYVNNGKVDFKVEGRIVIDGNEYSVKDGKIVK